MREGLLEVAARMSVCVSLAAPELIPVRLTVCVPASSAIVRLAMRSNAGASFTTLTVTVKVRVMRLFNVWLSFTVTVMVAVPLALATGANVRLPLVLGLT